MPMVKALKNFTGLPEEGGFVTRGTDIHVSDERHQALARNGLVTPPEAKQAPEPSNKMKAEPANKAITHASMQTRRVPLDAPSAAEQLAANAPKVALSDPQAADKIVEGGLPLAGGPTGEGAPASSSPRARPRRKPRSN